MKRWLILMLLLPSTVFAFGDVSYSYLDYERHQSTVRKPKEWAKPEPVIRVERYSPPVNDESVLVSGVRVKPVPEVIVKYVERVVYKKPLKPVVTESYEED